MAKARRDAPRLLMLGTVNHPHVEHLALAMADRGFEVVVAGDTVDGLARSVLPLAGIEVLPAPPGRRGSLAGAAAHVRWLRGLLRGLEPDVVHANWLCGFGCFAALAGARPLVAMAWGSDVLRARPLQRVANRVAVRRSEVLLGDSQLLVGKLVELGGRPDRCLLVKWGVDLETFRPSDDEERAALRRELGLGPGPVVLSPRSLLPVYNQPTIVAAWAEVAAERDDLQLVLKHMGVEGEDLGELPFPDRVHLVGHVEYERMAAYYRAADVCVSLASSDSAPRSVYEAMACGVPCVLSDLPWVHEEFDHRGEAMIVPIEREAAAQALRDLLADPGLAARISTSARRLVERRHDRRAHMDRLAAVYRSLL